MFKENLIICGITQTSRTHVSGFCNEMSSAISKKRSLIGIGQFVLIEQYREKMINSKMLVCQESLRIIP